MENEYIKQKKAWNKARRKAIRPFKGLAVFGGIMTVVMCLVLVLVLLMHSTMDIIMNGKTFTIVNGDESIQYFSSDFASDEEREAYEFALCRQVEAEGAALLMNNGALPLAEGAKVSTLSSSSVNLVYGGTGSGAVDASTADSLKTALEKSGLVVNPTLWDFYLTGEGSAYTREAGEGESFALAGQATIGEVPLAVYTQKVKDSITEYGDAVIITLSRVGGEGYDLAYELYNYLALSDNEKAMMAYAAQLKAEGKIKSIIVLINSSNALQVDFLKENEYSVDACLWIGGVGQNGTNAVADILAGKVNPSGRLVVAYLYDNYASPAMQNMGSFTYTNADELALTGSNKHYVVYQEGIYVGYRYFETRYEDFVMGTGNAGTYAYHDDVAYTFGYGLSYSTFEYSNVTAAYDEATDSFTVSVTVTNTGDVAGKETVQIYAQTPYTDYDKQYGVEKSAVQLCGFDKTEILEPGASQTLEITMDKRDLTAYDAYGAGTYILDAGTYYLTAAKDAHDAVNNILAAKGYTPENTAGRMDAAGDVSMVTSWEQAELDTTTYAVSAVTGAAIVNQFDDVDINRYAETEQSVTYLSRSDWEGTFPKTSVSLYATSHMAENLVDQRYDSADYEKVPMPTLGADNGMKLIELRGADYDDPRWEPLLDQMTFDEMALLIGQAFHYTQPVASIAMPGTRDENGPQGLTAGLTGGATAMAYTSEDVMAATFNTDLIYDLGRCIGNDCIRGNVSCLYGPGANIHRTAYSGRNFEYYSEDAFLSCTIGEAEVTGIESKGVFVVMKHFAMNDQESDRLGIGVWANEQTIREIYLKAFQGAIEHNTIAGVMTSYTRYGCHWSGADEGNLNVIRDEWGCQGLIISDNSGTCAYMNACDALLVGSSCFDAMTDLFQYNNLLNYRNDPVIVTAMREACHQMAYSVVNSQGMNGMTEESSIELRMQDHMVVLWSVFAVFAVLFVTCTAVTIVKGRKFRQENPKPVKVKA